MAGKIKYLWIFVFLLVMPMAFAGTGERITYIERDTFVRSNDANTNFGTESEMYVRCYPTGNHEFGFMYLNSSDLNINNLDQYSLISADLYQYDVGNWYYFAVDVNIYNATDIGYNHSNITYNNWESQVNTTGTTAIEQQGYENQYVGWYPTDISSWLSPLGAWNGILYFRASSFSCGSTVGAYYNTSRTSNVPYLKLNYEYGFDINALDNYTKYGYNQTDISNFTIDMTNGTTTLTNTSNGTTINMGDLVGLWNITLSHPDYSNVTYENYNVSSDLTGYMYQTHHHFENTSEIGDINRYMVNDTYVVENYANINYVANNYLQMNDANGEFTHGLFLLNMSKNINVNISELLSFTQYYYKYYIQNDNHNEIKRYEMLPIPCVAEAGETSLWSGTMYNVTYNTRPDLFCSEAMSSVYSGGGGIGWVDIYMDSSDITFDTLNMYRYRGIQDGGANPDMEKVYSSKSGVNSPYALVEYTSNFTIAVIDGFSENPLYNTTVNISNGDWSIQDYYNNTNTKTYGFDEGVYNITVTTKSGLTTQTELNYDLATSSNYFQLEIALSEYAIFNLTIYDETTEDIINENLTINAIGTQYSEERTITTGNWYDISENFKAEEYWFSAQGTAGTNGSDWDFRTYYINFMDVGTGLNTIYMYLLNDTLTGEICLNVYDNSGSALADTYIELLRHYPSNNSYKTVQIAKTDNNGYATLIAVPNTVVYKYLIKTSLSASASFTSNPAYLTDSSCYNIYLTTGEPVGVDWFNSQGVDYSYYYSESTASMNYLWDDSSNNVANACLKTYRMGVFKSLIEESCVSSAAGQISHTVDNTTEATYTSYMYVTMADDLSYEIFIGSFSHTIDLQIASTIGTLGLFLVILVIITIGMVGIWNGGVAVMLTGVAILLAQATGIILLNFVWTIGIIAVGGIIIYLNKD